MEFLIWVFFALFSNNLQFFILHGDPLQKSIWAKPEVHSEFARELVTSPSVRDSTLFVTVKLFSLIFLTDPPLSDTPCFVKFILEAMEMLLC